MPIPVLIDCDPGYDDVIAIMLALASPEVEVLGITTVEGNQPVAETTENALRVVEFLAREIPVAAGANRPLVRELPFRRTPSTVDADVRRDIPGLPPATGRAVDEHAVDLLARVLLAADEPVTLVPLGPLTNVALLLARYPDAAERIGRMVLMGGAIGEGNATTAAEFNIYVDPESAQRVFSSGIDLTMVGLDVTYRAIVSPAELEELRGLGRAGGVVAAILDSVSALSPLLVVSGGVPGARRGRGGRARAPGAPDHGVPERRGGMLVGAFARAHGRRPARPQRPRAQRPCRRRRRHGRLRAPPDRAPAHARVKERGGMRDRNSANASALRWGQFRPYIAFESFGCTQLTQLRRPL